MPFDTERLIHQDPPTPEQLHALAAVGVRSAVERGKLKSPKQRGFHYSYDDFDQVLATEVQEDLPLQINHRMAIRVGARPAQDRLPRIWSLKYFDTYQVESRTNPGMYVGERSTYRFEWTRSRVLLADRAILLFGYPTRHDGRIEDYLEDFSVRENELEILAFGNDLITVSSGDCEELTKDITSYFSVIDAHDRGYNSSRSRR